MRCDMCDCCTSKTVKIKNRKNGTELNICRGCAVQNGFIKKATRYPLGMQILRLHQRGSVCRRTGFSGMRPVRSRMGRL